MLTNIPSYKKHYKELHPQNKKKEAQKKEESAPTNAVSWYNGEETPTYEKLGIKTQQDKSWFTDFEINPHKYQLNDLDSIRNFYMHGKRLFDAHVIAEQRQQINTRKQMKQGKRPDANSKTDFYQKVLVDGTASDRISVLSVLISQKPTSNLEHFTELYKYITSQNHRASELAIETCRDLFSKTLLPLNRKLFNFKDQPLHLLVEYIKKNLKPKAEENEQADKKKNSRDKSFDVSKYDLDTFVGENLFYWVFEDELKKIFISFCQVAESVLTKSPFIHTKQVLVRAIRDIVKKAPEAHEDNRLLDPLITVMRFDTKLTDANETKSYGNIGAYTSQVLLSLVNSYQSEDYKNPHFTPHLSKKKVCEKVASFLFYEKSTSKTVNYAIVFLSNVELWDPTDQKLAVFMIETYLKAFKWIMEKIDPLSYVSEEIKPVPQVPKEENPENTETKTDSKTEQNAKKTAHEKYLKDRRRNYKHYMQLKKVQEKKKEATENYFSSDYAAFYERILKSLLLGVAKALPISKLTYKYFEKDFEEFVKVGLQSNNFSVRVAAMKMLQKIISSIDVKYTGLYKKGTKKQDQNKEKETTDAVDKNKINDVVSKYFCVIYANLFYPSLLSSTSAPKTTAEFLNLTMRAIAKDREPKRQKAFLKRLMQTSFHTVPAVTISIQLIVLEILKLKPLLKTLLLLNESSFEEEFEAFQQQNQVLLPEKTDKNSKPDQKNSLQYDPLNFVPQNSNADKSCLWEITLAGLHFHPAVQKLATHLSSHQKIQKFPGYHSNPIDDFSLSNFLEKMIFVKPAHKKPREGFDPIRGVSMPLKSTLSAPQDDKEAEATAVKKPQNIDEPVFASEKFLQKFLKIKQTKLKKKGQNQKEKKEGKEEEEDNSDIEEEEEGSEIDDEDEDMKDNEKYEEDDDEDEVALSEEELSKKLKQLENLDSVGDEADDQLAIETFPEDDADEEIGADEEDPEDDEDLGDLDLDDDDDVEGAEDDDDIDEEELDELLGEVASSDEEDAEEEDDDDDKEEGEAEDAKKKKQKGKNGEPEKKKRKIGEKYGFAVTDLGESERAAAMPKSDEAAAIFEEEEDELLEESKKRAKQDKTFEFDQKEKGKADKRDKREKKEKKEKKPKKEKIEKKEKVEKIEKPKQPKQQKQGQKVHKHNNNQKKDRKRKRT